MLCKIEISNAVHGSDGDYCTVVLVDDVFGRLPELHDVPASQLYKYLETSTEEMVCNFSLGADTNRFETVDGAPFSDHAKSAQDILEVVCKKFNNFSLDGASDRDNRVIFEVAGVFYCAPQVIKCGGDVRANLFLYGRDAKDKSEGAVIYCVPEQGFVVLSARLGSFSHPWGYVKNILSEDAARALVIPVSAGVGWHFTGDRVADELGDLGRGCKDVVMYTYEKAGEVCEIVAYTNASGELRSRENGHDSDDEDEDAESKLHFFEAAWLCDDALRRYERYIAELSKDDSHFGGETELCDLDGESDSPDGLDVEAIQEDMQWAHDKLIRRINETYRVLNMYCDVGKGEPGLIVHSGDYVSYGVDASGYPLGQYEIIDADLNDTFHELGFDEIVLCGADKDHVGCHKTSDESLTVYVDLAADYVRGFKSHIGKK